MQTMQYNFAVNLNCLNDIRMVLDKMICSTILKQFTKKIMVIKKGNQLTMKNQVRFFELVLLITHSSLQILAILCMIMIMLKEGVNKETSMSFMTKISSDLFLNPSLLLASDLIFVFVIVLILNYG